MEINTDSKLSSQHKISVLHMINSVPGEIDARGPTLDEKTDLLMFAKGANMW